MASPYDKQLLEKVDRFLAGEMPAQEREEFEKQLQSDAQLQQAMEHHKALIEGVRMSTYLRERDRWRAVQDAIEEEDDDDEEEEADRRGPSRKGPSWGLVLILMIASFVVGFMGVQLFERFSKPVQTEMPPPDVPIAGNEEEELPLGYIGERIEKDMIYIEVLETDGQLSVRNRTPRKIILQEEDQSWITYELSDGLLRLELPAVAREGVINAQVEWIVIIDESGERKAQYLKLDGYFFLLKEEYGAQMLGSVRNPLLERLKTPE